MRFLCKLSALRRAVLAVVCVLALLPADVAAQIVNPVKFTVTTRRISPETIDVVFTGKIQSGWHVYSVNVPEGGPTAATFTLSEASGVEKVGSLRQGSGAVKKHDDMFGMEVEYFENECRFTQRLRLVSRAYSAKGYLEYGACSDHSCLPPTEVDFSVSGSDGPAKLPAEQADKAAAAPPLAALPTDTPPVQAVVADTSANVSAAVADVDSAVMWEPQVSVLHAQNGMDASGHRSLLMIFVLGFLGGLVALFTPCVWPIIPMTVSFFLHRGSSRRRAVREAVTYGAAIVVIYVSLGLAITAIFGGNAMNSLSTNALFNIFFFLLLVVFAASFLGGFEITLPASWGNKVNAASRSSAGVLSIFLMALTLVIVSFSCTGPIIGLLLAEVATYGHILAPALGMLGFAIALALPFALFAMFPAWMSKLPKSGSWMNTVKVTLGFIELAFSLKFLSVADLAYGWHILDRETFLVLWIAISAVAALFFFGVVNIGSEKPAKVSVTRVMLGIVSLAFAVYLVPGLWGAPLKAVSAFAPPMSTQDFVLGSNEVRARFNSYEEAVQAAAREGKPVLIDFTGYGCVNCRKMEASVWTDPTVSKLLSEKFILVSLYTDDKRSLPAEMSLEIGGRAKKIRTIGGKWSAFQQVKYGANAQPFYVAVDNQGRPLAGSYAFDENPRHFESYLRKALDAAAALHDK